MAMALRIRNMLEITIFSFRMQLIYNNIKEYVGICISLISNRELL